ncbi:MAG: hypothetical protein VX938_10060 [Myxococcota bacterium]|nr:hypothetical protein [Myxococcota bacterium]
MLLDSATVKTSTMESWFAENTSGRRVLLAFIVTALGSSWFGYLHTGLEELVGPDLAKIPDTMPWLSPDVLFGTFAELGQEGRDFYIFGLYTDFIYPLTYWIFMGLLYSLAVKRSGQHGTRLVWFPTALMLCDQIENIAFLFVVSWWPEKLWVMAVIGCLAHGAKWFCALPSLVLMFRCAYEVLRPQRS